MSNAYPTRYGTVIRDAYIPHPAQQGEEHKGEVTYLIRITINPRAFAASRDREAVVLPNNQTTVFRT